jgi:dolichyl-diphosphooligosaccharide--protein glycosyltransferase
MTLLFGYNDSSSFLLIYGIAAYYFSLKMVRLILLTAPIASMLGGIVVGRLFSWGILSALFAWTDTEPPIDKKGTKKSKPIGKNTKKDKKTDSSDKLDEKTENLETRNFQRSTMPWVLRGVRVAAAVYAMRLGKPYVEEFYKRSHDVAKSISHPTIIQKARTRDGEVVIVDDYREAYKWLAQNTPEDARIMAWWDYGYQINGIANRTTIADGNTWNHEHIALLGRILTAPEKEAHRIARHLADYVLIWAGGGGDDLAKSPHLRRIANSVYRGLCKEPTCREFGFYVSTNPAAQVLDVTASLTFLFALLFLQSNRVPTDDMRESLLYTLHSNGINPGVVVDRNRFREVYTSKYGKVRIYKIQSVSEESKQWVLNNRVCDAPGSWFCPGRYPPALEEILAQKRDFAQLEDFNRKTEGDDDYTKDYFENLNKKHRPEGSDAPKNTVKKLTADAIEKYNDKEYWQNNELTTLVWELISEGKMRELYDLIASNPAVPHLRSEDGRGPMWWAHEYKREKIVEFLKRLGVSEDREDANGITPLNMKN